MGLKLKSFSLVLVMLFICHTVAAVKILRPGDTAKGKKVMETLYCLSEGEVKLILKKIADVDSASRTISLLESKDRMSRDVIDTQDNMIENLAKQLNTMQGYVNGSVAREKKLEAAVKDAMKSNAKTRRSRNFFRSLSLLGVGAAIGFSH